MSADITKFYTNVSEHISLFFFIFTAKRVSILKGHHRANT